jgi:hypothetical protein
MLSECSDESSYCLGKYGAFSDKRMDLILVVTRQLVLWVPVVACLDLKELLALTNAQWEVRLSEKLNKIPPV